ncbi:MAG: heparinase II/III family protein [Paenibacillus macerans]|uniref:heparinase II/III domain-containing protein n=1 Tax=Paenibacillus TaxID=44249 RepID=UPI001F0CF055|nr:heparinase II/III family protein [Paenibacillus macerans]MDU7475422.1 heparinase II/III family protein [Paenibacillus macerans]UMV45671.1 heparinase II/III-family protein [Paenibacillus macerans]
MKPINGKGAAASYGLYNADELEAVRNRIRMNPALQQEYLRQKELSERYAAQAMTAPLEEQANFRTYPFVFKVPEGVRHVLVSIHFAGKGIARISDMRLTHSQRGLPVELDNANFAQDLAHWEAEVAEGSELRPLPLSLGAAALQPSGVTTASGVDTVASGVDTTASGVDTMAGGVDTTAKAQCVYVANAFADVDTVLHYDTPIPVRAGEHYSVQITLSLEAPLTVGVYTEVRFRGNEGPLEREASLCSPPFNRATPSPWAYFLEAAGADANRFMVEGDLASAERCKQKLLYMLCDMIQGMEIFKATGWHDDDIYGAVHIGRGLAVLSVIYRQIAPSGVFGPDPDEEAMLLAFFRYIANLMMDTGYYRYDLAEFPDEKGGMRSNWNADRATGLGVYALLFPQEPKAEEYLEHALSVVDWQLDHVVDDCGAWPENIRYHGAVLHRYFLFFVLLKRLKGADYFQHEKVKGMYRFLIGTAVPADRMQAGPDGPAVMLTPAVGDANVQEHWFRLLGYAAPSFVENDPKLAKDMMWAWRRGGAPVRDTGAFPYPLAALLFPKPDLPEEAPELGSIHYPGMGYVIFRNPQGPNRYEHYAIYEASPLTYHAHHDEGHFSIWSNQVPLTLDSGTGGYYNGDRHWYVSSAAHNVVQFAGPAGEWQEVPLRSHCEQVVFSAELDYVRSRIPDPNIREYHRHFVFIKAGLEVYLVWDHIDGEAGQVWNLHTLSTEADIGEQHIEAHGLGGMHLSAVIAEPKRPVIVMDQGAVAGNYPLSVQQHFKVYGRANNDYLVLLHPHEEGELSVHIEAIQLDNPARTEVAPLEDQLSAQTAQLDDPLSAQAAHWDNRPSNQTEAPHSDPRPPQVRCYKIVKPDGAWCIVVVNGSKRTQTLNLAALGSLRLLGGQNQANGENGENGGNGGELNGQSLQIEANRLCVLLPQSD